MAEAAPAKSATATPHGITVSSSANPIPLTTGAAITDVIVFTVLSKPVYIWTWNAAGNPANIFSGETGDYLYLPVGPSSQYGFNTSVVSPGQAITFQANADAPSLPRTADVKGPLTGVRGTINITSNMP